MLLSGAQLLGPVARRLICPERWTDAYPAWESFAQELDALLEYADAEGGLHHLAPRLESKNAQRDEALEELRGAYWLDHVEVALYNRHPGYGTTGYFNSPSYENLGGVGIFRAFSGGRGVEYEFKIFDNPFALPATKLPASLMGTFKEKKTGIVRATFTGNTTRHVF